MRLRMPIAVAAIVLSFCLAYAPAQVQEAAAKAPAAGGKDFGAEKFRLVNQADEIVSVLENGLVVIAKRVDSPAVSVCGFAHTGGVYEGKWLGGGLSHLLEHLVAGGSSERRTEAQNRDLLQKIGNDSNAYTTSDYTTYFVNTTTDNMKDAVDLVTGWMLGAKITPEEYRREYEVVQRELEMGKGEPDRVMYYMSAMNRYRVSPARVPVIGYQEVIQGLSRDDVYTYYKLAYAPNNMVFSLAGNIDPEVMLKAVQTNVAAAPPQRAFSHEVADEPPVTAPRTAVATFPKLGQAKLQLAFPTIKLYDADLYAMDLLATILGGGESSLLVDELRDKRQLVSSIDATSETPTYAEGSFEIDMDVDPEKLAAATQSTLELLEQLKQKGIDAGRLARAKTQMKVRRLRQMDTAEEIAASMATDYLSSGDPHFSDRYVKQIEQVTAEQVKQVAQKYFDRNRLLTTALLPAEYVGAAGMPKAEDLLRPVAPTTRPVEATPATAITRTVLEDGTILLAKQMPASPLVSVQMYALGGITLEDDKNSGIGNLTMEMLPRGTKTRTAAQIAEFFDSIGGSFDTTVQANYWTWSVSVLPQDLETTFEVFADIVNNPAFDAAESDSMKKRILASIAAQDADWLSQAFRFFKKSYYAPMNSPYRLMPTGTAQTVPTFTPGQLRSWYVQKVLPARRVLAIFGNVDPAQAQKLARHYLRGTPPPSAAPNAQQAGDSQKACAAADTSPSAGVNVTRVEIQPTQQALAGILIGYKSDSYLGDPANYSIDVADTMASGFGYPTGYLHEILRGRGLVYVVHAANSPGLGPQLPGTFFAYAGCEAKNVNEVVETILENIARLQGTSAEMNVDWFARSKELILVSDALDQQTAAQQAGTAARDELYGLGYDYHARFAEKIKAVELSQVRQIAQRRFSECVVTICTPQPDAVKIKTGRRDYKSFPPVDLTPRGVQHDSGAAQ